ncbi:hypothetical protein BDZ91DRAFT_724778 [Kalaharituber pfeilii]|nr:hypothetical protein BDZ91DRAFT_724778 [Kalaharituber pfeilii]
MKPSTIRCSSLKQTNRPCQIRCIGGQTWIFFLLLTYAIVTQLVACKSGFLQLALCPVYTQIKSILVIEPWVNELLRKSRRVSNGLVTSNVGATSVSVPSKRRQGRGAPASS